MSALSHGGGRPVRFGWMRPWHPSPLLRPLDRAEAVLRLVVVAAVLLTVPLAWSLGTEVAAADAARIRIERETRTAVQATVVTEPAEVAPYTVRATVRWDESGRSGTAEAAVPRAASAGDRVTLWLDPANRPVLAPRSPDAAPIGGIGTGVLVLSAAAGLGWLLVRAVALLLDRHRYAAWGAAWERSAPRRYRDPPAAV
ncbi:hypothetical protein AB0H71_07405 [Nocardia sp. NPDC050697]|uniref:Rv1733c family protein n=1 Tax=Nocardia sp. NPDC050697 TaxID=3155158 RepID=UPI0033EEA4B6